MRCRGQPLFPASEDWLAIFRGSIGSFKATAAADTSLPQPEAARRAEAFAADYARRLEEVEREALAHAAPHPAATGGARTIWTAGGAYSSAQGFRLAERAVSRSSHSRALNG